jgi:hypothetical protein
MNRFPYFNSFTSEEDESNSEWHQHVRLPLSPDIYAQSQQGKEDSDEKRENKDDTIDIDHQQKMHILLLIMDALQINEVEFFQFLSDPNNRVV